MELGSWLHARWHKSRKAAVECVGVQLGFMWRSNGTRLAVLQSMDHANGSTTVKVLALDAPPIVAALRSPQFRRWGVVVTTTPTPEVLLTVAARERPDSVVMVAGLLDPR